MNPLEETVTSAALKELGPEYMNSCDLTNLIDDNDKAQLVKAGPGPIEDNEIK